MTTEASEVGAVLADLAAQAKERGRDDLAAQAEAVRRDSPRSLVLVAADGADAPRLAAWIARTVPDLTVRTLETATPADGLGKVALVLRADQLVGAATHDRFAALSALASKAAIAVVAVGAGALDGADLPRVGRGLGRTFHPDTNVELADLSANRVFLFEDGAVGSESAREPLERSLAAFVAWLREPTLPDANHRAILGLRILDSLPASAPRAPASEPAPSAERLRALAARVVRQFESEFETASASVESSLGSLQQDVEGVLRHGQRGSADSDTPVDVRVDLWESRAHEAVERMLGRTREYAEGLLRDVPWDDLETRAKAAGLPGEFRKRLLAAWREADEAPLPHIGESVRRSLGEVPTTPQAPALVQAGIGIFGGAVAGLLLGPIIGIGIAVAGVAGVAVGMHGSRQAAADLAPVFAEARTGIAENLDAYLGRIRARTVAILEEAAVAAERPDPRAASASIDALANLRDRLVRAAIPS